MHATILLKLRKYCVFLRIRKSGCRQFLSINHYEMSSKPDAVYEFGGYQLNSVRGSLSMSGQRIDLPEKALEALIYLAEHSGKLVTTTELTKQLWSARPVHGGSIRRLITELRGILNDDWRNPRYIQ